MTIADLELPGHLVSAAWLADHLSHPALVVCDVRWYYDGRQAEAAYDAGHLPGAVWIDVDGELAGSPKAGPGRHPLPTPEHFAAAMAAKGIGDDSVVVAYDDTGGSTAARLWWMLTAIGRRAAVLDGGISAWTGELSIDVSAAPAEVVFTPTPWPSERVADVVRVDEVRRTPGAGLILDARAADRFAGAPNPLDTRQGHIPGAVSAPWKDNVDPETGTLLPAAALRSRYESLGVTDAASVICQCGSGVTACLDILALALAGLGDAQLYPGSWSDWTAEPTRPVGPDD